MINFVTILVLFISTTIVATATKCVLNEKCDCVEKGENVFSRVNCIDVTEFPEFNAPKDKYAVENLMVVGEIRVMPETGLDMFKYVNHTTIERTNSEEAFSIQGGAAYIFTNCKLEKLTLIGFQEALPLSSESGYGVDIHPKTLATLVDVSIQKSAVRFTKDAFIGANSLERLALPNNHIVDGAFRASDTFDPINNTLMELDFSNNKIETYQPSFQILGNLRVLRLSSNELSNINSANFAQFPNLKILALDQNKLIKFDAPSLFQNGSTSILEELYLDENGMSTIPFDTLNILNELKIFSFSQNYVRNLTSNSFANLRLEKLHLDYNPIENFEFDALCELKKLKSFSIIGWEIENLDLSALNGTELEILKIQNNKNLTTLTVSNLQFVPETLAKIEIKGNNLQSINNSIAELFKNNTKLIVSISNESNIDCGVGWISIDSNTTTSQIDSQSLTWLANLAACHDGNRIRIDETSVFCSVKSGQNETEPMNFLDFLRGLDHNCPPKPTTPVPQTTNASEQPASGGMPVADPIFNSLIVIAMGFIIKMIRL